MKSQMRQMPQRSRPASLWAMHAAGQPMEQACSADGQGMGQACGQEPLRSAEWVCWQLTSTQLGHQPASASLAHSSTHHPCAYRTGREARAGAGLGRPAPALPHIDPYILSVIILSDQARCAPLLRPTHARICPTPPRLAEPHTHTPSDRALGSSFIAACLRAGEDTAATNPLCSPPRHFFVGTLCRATLTFFCALSLELEYLQSSLLSLTHTACHSQKPPGTASQKRKSVHRDYQNPVRTLSEPVRTLSEPVRTLSERCEAKYGLS